MHPILAGFLASLAAGLATPLGALPILFVREISTRLQGILLGFGGGVMLAATAFSLLAPGIEAALDQGFSNFGAGSVMVVGVLLGGAFLELAHRYFPHEHVFKGVEGSNTAHLARIWLFVIAITLHNFPEGLAVGVVYGSAEGSVQGLGLTIGIALQNMPEGLVVATALVGQGYSSTYALGVSLLTGLVEPIGGVIGASVVSVAKPLLPWGLAFAAGAMLFVISDEIIPESHRQGHEREGTLGIMIGFVLMMLLDVTFG
jgi:ZIP family zinc transporter